MHGTGDGVEEASSDALGVGSLQDGARASSARRLLNAGASRDAALQAFVELASRLLETPSAEMSLFTDVRVLVGAVNALPVPAGGKTPLDQSLCARVADTGEPLVVNDAGTDPRLADLDVADYDVASLRLGAYLGVPVVGDDRQVVGALCVHQPEPREWTAQDVATLTHLAASAAAQLEAHALDLQYARGDRLALLDAAAQAAGLGTFQWDVTTGALHWDATLLKVFGYDEETFAGTMAAFNARLHPDDVAPVAAAIDEAIATCGVYEAEFRVLRPGGRMRWLASRGRALAGRSGAAEQIIGVTTDTTALREGEERVQQILEDMAVGYFWLDPAFRFGYVNSEGERILGRTRDELVGGDIWELFPAAVGTNFEESYRGVARTGEPVVFDAYYPAPLDAWYEVRAMPERGGVAVYFTDITERRRALEIAQQAHARSTLRAAVGAELVEALDPVEALEAVLPHLVPSIADFAIASLLDDGHEPWRSRLHDVAALHADPTLQPVLERYRELRVPALSETSLIADVLTKPRRAQALLTGAPLPGELLDDGQAHETLLELEPHAMAVMPLRGRGHTHGLISLVRGEARGEFTAGELSVLREVTAQIGLALDNAHLLAAQRNLAEELQRSLLTELPQPDHLHLCARYVPAATGAQIGGDWYDAFLLRDGSTCLVIGDVSGHDLHAAVSMAQVRNVLRGGAHAVVQSPAAILTSLDWALRDLAVGALSTSILAKLEQPEDLAEQGVRQLRWSSAGHLPPLLIHPDGHAELLLRPADLALGLRVHAQRRDHTHTIPPGATVLLYTDGLVERRDESLVDGLERLRALAESLAGLPLEDLCDRLVADLAADSEDDVALLAVRALHQARPRPAEAGPERLADDIVEGLGRVRTPERLDPA